MEVTYNDLVCKVCKEFTSSPIHVCINGHKVCGICIKKVTQCNICQKDLSSFEMAEKVFYQNNTRLGCKYLKAGCSERVSATAMKEHVFGLCKFRPSNEIPEVLSKNGDFEVNHSYSSLETNHPRSFLTIKYDGNKFFYHSALEDNMFYFWMSVIGDEKIAHQYRLVLNFPLKVEVESNGSSNEITPSSSLPVVPFRDSELIKVQEKGEVAAIPCNMLVPFFLEVENPATMEKKIYTLDNVHKIIKFNKYKLRSCFAFEEQN